MRPEEEKVLTEELLGIDLLPNESMPLPDPSVMPMPELAIPLPPPPGGENDA